VCGKLYSYDTPIENHLNRDIAPYLDAINIDLKAFSEKSCKSVCGTRLAPVLETIQLMKTLGVWVEVTTLIIPGLNDGSSELQDIARFINSVGLEIPWHVSRFYPAYQMLDRPQTPLETLNLACDIGREEGLQYVYQGNVPTEEGENTYCHNCGRRVIERYGLQRIKNHLEKGKCPDCGTKLAGVLM